MGHHRNVSLLPSDAAERVKNKPRHGTRAPLVSDRGPAARVHQEPASWKKRLMGKVFEHQRYRDNR